MIVLGKTERGKANDFVQQFKTARLWSMSVDGDCRVATTASGDDLQLQQNAFTKIATSIPRRESLPVLIEEAIIPCAYRGSKRKTCCGSPGVWICRELKTDCVADESVAAKLRGMVDTVEASSIKVCSTCRHRKPTAPRVGFLSAAYMSIGGTETFHRSLLPRLRSSVDVMGFAATAFHGGDGSLLQVPYLTGVQAAKTLAEKCNIVVVWGIHDLANILPGNRPKVIAVHHSDWSSDWNNNLILNQINLIDEVICVNENTTTQLSVCGKPTHWIPNAIDPTRIIPSGQQAQLRARHDIPMDSKIVLFGHRLSAEKRPLEAIQIAQQLPDNWIMVIAGDGSERAFVDAASADCDRVRIVGAVESLADWLAISDCFLSLSTFEGFGLSIGEAMAAGVPTVATPAGIAPGLATTLPTDSTAAEWADAIVKATPIVTPAEILDRFSVQRMVDSWASVIKGLQ